MMRTTVGVLAVAVGLTVIALVFQTAPQLTSAHSQSPAILAGQISSPEEGAMEGVVVSAKLDGSTITVSVVSDKRGQYSFPANRLEPGHYSLATRAVGYDLDSPGKADLTSQKTTTVDLKLRKTKNIVPQLTNAEWIMSVPGTEEQKLSLLDCLDCHTLERVMRSTHSADEYTQTIWRMQEYAYESEAIKPQRRMDPNWAGDPERYRQQANYLSTINLSSVPTWKYSFKRLPRPTGRATHVIVTEYDLPRRTIQPHDVIADEHGNIWYSDFGEQYIGELDPKTGKTKEYPLPELKPGYPVGLLDLEEDKNGALWAGMMMQGAIAKFDPNTEKFQIFNLPPELNDMVAQLNMLGLQYGVDGKVWTNNAGNQDVYRLDIATGKFEKFQPLKQLSSDRRRLIYGIASDSKNNLYIDEFWSNLIGRLDAETGEVKFYPTPTLNSGPRRMQMDSQDRLWFAEYRGNRIGMLDTKTEKFTEWPLRPWTGPYYVTRDKNGELWTGGMTTDRVVRLDPKTGQSVEYLLPKETNIRRVFVDNSTVPVTFWAGNNHSASIVKVEPLD
ncbi:MAG TPA: carboxypeptidase regulatory-like domain-containing protein [Candidatus Acidoferrales bacterium]|jgi:virginiamycin B lyase|nr:carboxypeptidase regulatory-like domain-containing protein [Candidatus Acidoferrales bacterium]